MQQISTEREEDFARLDRQGDPLRIVQEIEVWPYEQMIYAQPRILFWRMTRTNSSGILRYKRITYSLPDDRTL